MNFDYAFNKYWAENRARILGWHNVPDPVTEMRVMEHYFSVFKAGYEVNAVIKGSK